jgi:hypothetical protein
MLNNTNKLFFPKIAFEKSVEISPNNAENKILNLYTLDWTRKERKCSQGLEELSFEYETIIKSLKFAISDAYLREIRRASWSAAYELNVNRSLDSSLKRTYMSPVVSYIEEAFRLLADSSFDEQTNFYYRGKNKIILPHLLLYKFWKKQTQNSMILNFTRTDELLTISMNENLAVEQQTSINKFLNFVNEDMNSN